MNNNITLNMNNSASVFNVHQCLDIMFQANRFFVIQFIELKGELREINGIAKNYKLVKGQGTKGQKTRYLNYKHKIFKCYEVNITKKEKELYLAQKEQFDLSPKVIGFKSIYIQNIKQIRCYGYDIKIINNNLKLDK